MAKKKEPEQTEEPPERPSDQEVEDRRQSELQAERDYRRERLGHHVPGQSTEETQEEKEEN